MSSFLYTKKKNHIIAKVLSYFLMTEIHARNHFPLQLHQGGVRSFTWLLGKRNKKKKKCISFSLSIPISNLYYLSQTFCFLCAEIHLVMLRWQEHKRASIITGSCWAFGKPRQTPQWANRDARQHLFTLAIREANLAEAKASQPAAETRHVIPLYKLLLKRSKPV